MQKCGYITTPVTCPLPVVSHEGQNQTPLNYLQITKQTSQWLFTQLQHPVVAEQGVVCSLTCVNSIWHKLSRRRELPGAVHGGAGLRLQGLHLPQGDSSVHVPGRLLSLSLFSFLCVFFLNCPACNPGCVFPGRRLHKPQWNWREIYLRAEVSGWELQTDAHWTRW